MKLRIWLCLLAYCVVTITNPFDRFLSGALAAEQETTSPVSYVFTLAGCDDLLTDSEALGWSQFPQPGALRTESCTFDTTNITLLATVGTDFGPYNNWATFGWITNGQNGTQCLNYAAVGTGKIVRAKFYMFAAGQSGSALNQIPSLRMRVANRFAVTASLIVRTNGGVAGDLMDQDIAPSQDPNLPSVYKVDLDPTDTPRLVSNANNEAFLRAFEVYDFAPQVNGSIGMTESQIGTYPAAAVADAGPDVVPVTSSTGLIKDWLGGANGGDFGQGSGNQFNGNWSGSVSKMINGAYVTGGGQPIVTSNPSGIYMDTLSIETDGLGLVGYNMFGGTDEYPRTTATREVAARVEPGKLYKVKFHATATVNANRQPLIRFRARTMAFDWTSTLEIGGANAIGIGSNTYLMSSEVSPGVGNLLPDADRMVGDTTGGWYNVILTTPMDAEIKPSQPTLDAQDPPGVATGSVFSLSRSRRDIQIGVDIIDDFGGVGYLEFGQLQLDRVQVMKLDAVN